MDEEGPHVDARIAFVHAHGPRRDEGLERQQRSHGEQVAGQRDWRAEVAQLGRRQQDGGRSPAAASSQALVNADLIVIVRRTERDRQPEIRAGGDAIAFDVHRSPEASARKQGG